MKDGIHPQYRDVVFLDTATGHQFVTRSTIQTGETTKFEGKDYPLVKVEISSASHPFFTGKMKYVDSAGRVEKFQRKYKWDQRKGSGEEKAATEETAQA